MADDGTIVGLEEDYRAANARKPNRDGYELYLLGSLEGCFQGNWSLCYQISFATLQGKDVCRVDVQPASSPVYTTQGDLYIREGTRKRKLSPREAIDYVRQRWP